MPIITFYLYLLHKFNKAGAQIDLLILRDDNIVNLCEMKFTSTPYSMDKEEEAMHIGKNP